MCDFYEHQKLSKMKNFSSKIFVGMKLFVYLCTEISYKIFNPKTVLY